MQWNNFKYFFKIIYNLRSGELKSFSNKDLFL